MSFARSTPCGTGCVDVTDKTCPEPATKGTIVGGAGPTGVTCGPIGKCELSWTGVTVKVAGITPPAACVVVVVVAGGVVSVGAGVVLIGVGVGVSLEGVVL